MIDELRAFSETPAFRTGRTPRVGVTTRLAPLPAWKQAADFLFVQVSFSLDALLRWRETIEFDGPVYAGVMVLSSPAMARRLAVDLPQIGIPPYWVDAVDQHRDAGVDLACDLVSQVRDSRVFAGVHLVPVSRYRQVAARLEARL